MEGIVSQNIQFFGSVAETLHCFLIIIVLFVFRNFAVYLNTNGEGVVSQNIQFFGSVVETQHCFGIVIVLEVVNTMNIILLLSGFMEWLVS